MKTLIKKAFELRIGDVVKYGDGYRTITYIRRYTKTNTVTLKFICGKITTINNTDIEVAEHMVSQGRCLVALSWLDVIQEHYPKARFIGALYADHVMFFINNDTMLLFCCGLLYVKKGYKAGESTCKMVLSINEALEAVKQTEPA